MNQRQTVTRILDNISHSEPEVLLEKFIFGTKRENELLFFFKPEVFWHSNKTQLKNLFHLVVDKFHQFKVEISGVLLLSGKRLEELAIIDRHYGIINQLSKQASTMVEDDDIKKIAALMGIENIKIDEILGGHEFMKKYTEFHSEAVNNFWNTKKSIKLRSGFYCQLYEYQQRSILLVNGFHPLQLRRFTNPRHHIVVFLLHTDTDWKVLKADLVGDTYPNLAKPGSIRAEIFREPVAYGFPDVSVSNNGVHLSAGPFEALFEIDNFLKHLPAVGYELNNTRLGKLMLEKGYSPEALARSLTNPGVVIDGHEKNLFGVTEEKNSTAAVLEYPVIPLFFQLEK